MFSIYIAEMNPLEFLPKEIEDIIVGYKQQLEIQEHIERNKYILEDINDIDYRINENGSSRNKLGMPKDYFTEEEIEEMKQLEEEEDYEAIEDFYPNTVYYMPVIQKLPYYSFKKSFIADRYVRVQYDGMDYDSFH